MTANDGKDRGFLLCTAHDTPVTLSDCVIKHWDGGYCSSQRFTTEYLTRDQAMALLLVAAGQRAMGLPPERKL